MSSRRLFLALWPDAPMRATLASAVRDAVSACRGGRPVPPESLHVTLAFLGSVPESSLPSLTTLVGELVRRGAPARGRLDVRLDTIEYWRRSQLLCATASVEPVGVVVLAEALRSELARAGFHTDLKPFRAHVTLARQVRGAPHDAGMPAVTWRFGGLALIESRTLPEGSSYSVVEAWTLESNALEGPAPPLPDTAAQDR